MRKTLKVSLTRYRHISNVNVSGFTLIEIVITIVIVGIIAGLAAMIITQGVRAYSNERSRSDVHYQARVAVERMAREIRTARQTSEIGADVLGNIDVNPSGRIIFVDATGANIIFSLTGSTLNRTEGGTPSALAQGVSSLVFRFYNSAGASVGVGLTTTVWSVEIDVTDQQGSESLQIRTRVHPRNF